MRQVTSHSDARRLLNGLEGDPSLISTLQAYIAAQERGPISYETLSDREHSIRASNRAAEAIARVAELHSAVEGLIARILAIEASQRDCGEVMEAILQMLDR